MKPTFLTYTKPLLCAMVQESNPEDAICTIEDALYDGADAFGIQLCYLKREYRTEEHLRRIFSYCEDKPIYLTSYRHVESEGMTDEECAELLLLGLRCGGTLCDVIGDLYHPEPQELTFDPEAVEKQKKLIDEIHALGGEVLISSHLHTFFTREQNLAYAKAQIQRGADVVKIVNFAQDEEQMMENLETIHLLKKELDKPFLFLANGPACKLIRQVGPAMGVCMYLCVQRYKTVSSKEQPQLRAAKAIRDNMNFRVL